MRNPIQIQSWMPVLIYSIIWMLSYKIFFIFCPGDEMAYWMLIFWLVMPLATVVTAYKLGRNSRWSILQMILFMFFYGAMYMMIRYVTFGHHGVGMEWHLMMIGVILFLAGFVTGRGMSKREVD